jgi:hypothetical protein
MEKMAGAAYPDAQDVHSSSLDSLGRPAHASDACTVGTETWDANFVYVCVAKNTWKRAPLASW